MLLSTRQHENENRGDGENNGIDADGCGYGYTGEVARDKMDARVVSVLCAAGYSTVSLDSGASALLRTTLPSGQLKRHNVSVEYLQ